MSQTAGRVAILGTVLLHVLLNHASQLQLQIAAHFKFVAQLVDNVQWGLPLSDLYVRHLVVYADVELEQHRASRLVVLLVGGFIGVQFAVLSYLGLLARLCWCLS